MNRPYTAEFGVVDGSVPVTYRATNTYRGKAVRRATRIMQLNAEIVALKGLLEAEKKQIERLAELQHKMIEKLAGLGLKVTFKAGEIGFEAIGADGK